MKPDEHTEEREIPAPLQALFAALDEPSALSSFDEVEARRRVALALDQALPPVAEDTPDARAPVRVAPSRRGWRLLPRVWLLAALALAGGGVLAAVGRQMWTTNGDEPPVNSVDAIAQSAVNSKVGGAREQIDAAQQEPRAPEPAAEPIDAAGSTAELPARELRAAERKPTPDLLGEANRARRAGKRSEAVRLYLQVVKRDPASQSAYVARVAAAQLLLTTSPREALTLFRQAQKSRPNGALEHEIQAGIRRASQAESSE